MEFIKGVISKLIALFFIFVEWVVSIIEKLGYAGIVVGMTLESSFFPFPSEVVIPPAGYLTVQGNMNIVLVILAGIFGSLLGSTINYVLAVKFGRTFLEKYSKYLFLTSEKLEKMDQFFAKHGEITTFIGRLIPVVRQYISFPAGLAKMHFGKFLFYTGLGAGIWVVILAFVGRAVGTNIDLIKQHVNTVLLICAPILVIILIVYIILHRRKKKREMLKDTEAL